MFNDLLQEIIDSQDAKINEVLTSKEEAEMRQQMAVPDCRPMDFDVTIPGWLARIEHWGKITYYHKDPENFWGKRKVKQKVFVDRISDPELNKIFGKWEIKRKGLTKCILSRVYIDLKGRKRTETFIVDIELRKELR